eukprot:scaffold10615_cov106-Isochrysis_galbana.AAC.10
MLSTAPANTRVGTPTTTTDHQRSHCGGVRTASRGGATTLATVVPGGTCTTAWAKERMSEYI